MKDASAEEIISVLGLQPLPREGGFYRETYRATEDIDVTALPPRYRKPRSFSTAIYYLLTPTAYSRLHRISTDEIFHFYLGDPVELLLLRGAEGTEVVTLGTDLFAGQVPQQTVPAHCWQGLKLRDGGKFALLGTTVAPGFEFEELEVADEMLVARQFPQLKDIVGPYMY